MPPDPDERGGVAEASPDTAPEGHDPAEAERTEHPESFDPGLETGYLRRGRRDHELDPEIGAAPFDPGEERYDGRRAKREERRREKAERKQRERPEALAEKERARERAEAERRAAEQRERAERERKERGERDRAVIERRRREEAVERQREERLKAERERAKRAHVERERLRERERAERERAERERAERERAEEKRRRREERDRELAEAKERKERERLERDRADRERKERKRRAKARPKATREPAAESGAEAASPAETKPARRRSATLLSQPGTAAKPARRRAKPPAKRATPRAEALERQRKARAARRDRVAKTEAATSLKAPTVKAGVALAVVSAIAIGAGSLLGLPVPLLNQDDDASATLAGDAALVALDKGSPTALTKGPYFPVVLDAPANFGEAAAKFGAPRSGHIHEGQDVFAKPGTPLVAVRDGVVLDGAGGENFYSTGGGNTLVIYSPIDDRSYVYLHMLKPALVRNGDEVRAGQPVGQLGCTGACDGPHLHFEVRNGRADFGADTKAIDPLPLMRQWPQRPAP